MMLLTTDWIIGLFMNCLPLELTSTFLDNFFKDGWPAFYNLAIGILRYHQDHMLLLNDGSDIVSVIKQIKHGSCIDNLMQSAASLSFRN